MSIYSSTPLRLTNLALLALMTLGACTPADETAPTVSDKMPRTMSIDIAGVPAGGITPVDHVGAWSADGYVLGWVRNLPGRDEFEVIHLTSEGFPQKAFYLDAHVTGATKLALASNRAALISGDTLWGEIQSSNGGWGRGIPGTHTVIDVTVNPAGGVSLLLDKSGTLVLADVDGAGTLLGAVEIGESVVPLGTQGLNPESYLTRVQLPGGASIPIVVTRPSTGELRLIRVNHGANTQNTELVTPAVGEFILAEEPLIHGADGSLWICGDSLHGGVDQIDLLQFTFDSIGVPTMVQSLAIQAPSPFIDLELDRVIEAGSLAPGMAGFFVAGRVSDAVETLGFVAHVEPGVGANWAVILSDNVGSTVTSVQLGRPEVASASNPLVVNAVLDRVGGQPYTAFWSLDPVSGVNDPGNEFLLEQHVRSQTIQMGNRWLYSTVLVEGPGHGLLTTDMSEEGFWVTDAIPAGSPFVAMGDYGTERLFFGMPDNEPAVTSWTQAGPRGGAGCVFNSATPSLALETVMVNPADVMPLVGAGWTSTLVLVPTTPDAALVLNSLPAPQILSGTTVNLCP
ncbi:MAG: hypothetical protein OSB42_06010 [Planctomycetota bacterium]|nr:hypothetical protein [Planctomycetota bacterium]